MKGGIFMEEEFVKFMINKGLSENSYKTYLNDLRIFKKYYKDSYGEELNELIRDDINSYKSYLKVHNAAPKTMNKKMAALKQYNLFLINKKVQTNLVILDSDYIKIQKSLIKKPIPSLQEINKLKHQTCKDTKNSVRDYCFITILIYGGVRANEIVTIRLVDVKPELRTIYIIGKGNKFREIIINNIMYDALMPYLEERNKMTTDSPYLFVGQKTNNTGGKPLSRNFVNRLLNKYKNICKIGILYPHLLRSYFCVTALKAGYTIDQVANQARTQQY